MSLSKFCSCARTYFTLIASVEVNVGVEWRNLKSHGLSSSHTVQHASLEVIIILQLETCDTTLDSFDGDDDLLVVNTSSELSV